MSSILYFMQIWVLPNANIFQACLFVLNVQITVFTFTESNPNKYWLLYALSWYSCETIDEVNCLPEIV